MSATPKPIRRSCCCAAGRTTFTATSRPPRCEFARLIWQLASPEWAFDDATFARTAAAFDNSDHVAIVIHNYRWLIGAVGEPHYNDLERRLAAFPAIAVPAINCA